MAELENFKVWSGRPSSLVDFHTGNAVEYARVLGALLVLSRPEWSARDMLLALWQLQGREVPNKSTMQRAGDALAACRAGQERDIPNFKGSELGRFPLVSADFWTSDHLSERSRRVDVFLVTRARGTLTLKRR